MRIIRGLVSSGMLTGLLTVASAAPPADVMQGLKTAVEAESATQAYTATVTVQLVRQPNGTIPKVPPKTFQVNRRPNHLLITIGDRLYGVNPRYGFRLVKRGDAWLLDATYSGYGSDGPARYSYENHVGKTEAMVARPLTSFTYLESFFDPLTSESLVAEPAPPPDQWLFRYTVSANGMDSTRSIRCQFTPDQHILLSAVRQSSAMLKNEFVFRRELDDAGRSKMIEEVMVDRGKKEPLQSHRCEFTGYTSTSAPEAEYYLPHYGLPEPDSVPKAASGGWPLWWIIPVVGVVAGLGWLLLRRRKRS